MFLTAFIWGFGCTVGGSLGLMCFVILHDLWGVLVKTKAAKRANELAELANTALMRRNELTEQQIEQLASIAQSAEFLCDLERNKLNQ
jgi:hypothetical protein